MTLFSRPTAQAADLGFGAHGRGRAVSRDPAHRISDVLEAIERCQRYLASLEADVGMVEMAEDAIERNLQIIGEAVKHLPAEITDAHRDVPCRIRGLRNILVHRYFGVEVDVVRDVVETHLPPLAEALRSHINFG